MLKKISIAIAASALLAASVAAQTKPTEKPAPKPEPAEQQQPQPTPRPEPARPEPSGQAVNVRLELTITDQTGPGEPTRKVITMIVADRQNGFIRSRASVRMPDPSGGFRWRDVIINVDARPVLLREGSVKVELGLEYQPTLPSERAAQNIAPDSIGANLNERIGIILDSGKALVISQAVDPSSDRRISVELKATVLK